MKWLSLFRIRDLICVIAGLITVGSAQAGWKSFSGGANKLEGMYVQSQTDRRMTIFYSCGFVSGPECRMDMQLKLPCTFEQSKFTIPIQYGERSTTAILECKGKGGSMKIPVGNVVYAYANIDVRPPNAVRFEPNYRVQYFYSWTITLPNQGDGAVPKFTDKKLVFNFDVNGSQEKYVFSTNGWEKKMEKFHQKWTMANKDQQLKILEMASGDSSQKETNTPAYIDELKALASLRWGLAHLPGFVE